jgi:hypothetical protein
LTAAHTALAGVYYKIGDESKTLGHARRVLFLARQMGNKEAEATAYNTIAMSHHLGQR